MSLKRKARDLKARDFDILIRRAHLGQLPAGLRSTQARPVRAIYRLGLIDCHGFTPPTRVSGGTGTIEIARSNIVAAISLASGIYCSRSIRSKS